jgi:hypothetical protein
MTETQPATTVQGAWQRLIGTLSHSTFWLALCSIILNVAPMYSEIMSDNPQVMRWIRIITATVWVLYLYLAGELAKPAPPGILSTKEK